MIIIFHQYDKGLFTCKQQTKLRSYKDHTQYIFVFIVTVHQCNSKNTEVIDSLYNYNYFSFFIEFIYQFNK